MFRGTALLFCWRGGEVLYEFEEYCLDIARRELRRDGELITVEPQIFDLLQYLIANRERVVSKDDLIASVWNGRIVSESTLSSSITIARQAIGDSGDQQRLVRTFARKGIRFVGKVQEELRREVPVHDSRWRRCLCRIGLRSRYSLSTT